MANVVLNLLLIPPLGIVGAGIALVVSYALILGLMYALTQRLFPVAYEWGRLALLVAVTAAIVAGGELLLPSAGLAGFAARSALWLAMPLLLWVPAFSARRNAPVYAGGCARPRSASGSPRSPPARPRVSPRASSRRAIAPEVIEAVRRDEDRL